MQLKSGRGKRVQAILSGPTLLVVATLLAGGCRNAAAPATAGAQTYAGLNVRVAAPHGPLSLLVHRYSRFWTIQHGAAVEVNTYDPVKDDGPPATADAWIIPAADLACWAAAGKLRPVPERFTSLVASNSYDWGDLLPLYRSLLLQYEGKTFALPIQGDTLVCLYRSDLFGDAGHRAAFQEKFGREPGPPATWEEYADLAEFFAQRLGSSSLPPLPADAAHLERDFYAVAAPYVLRATAEGARKLPPAEELHSFQFDFATGQPNLSAAGFVHGLRLLQRLQACRPPGTAPEPAACFRDGRAVLCLAHPAWIARCADSGSAARGKFDVCRVPGSRQVFSRGHAEPQDLGGDINYVAYLDGGWIGVVPASSGQPEAAFDLLAALGDRPTSREILGDPALGGMPTRRVHFSRIEDWYAFSLGPTGTAELSETVRQAVDPLPVNPALRLRVPDQRELQAILVEELRSVLDRKLEPDRALNNVVRRWKDRDEKRDAGARLEEYRRSLGR